MERAARRAAVTGEPATGEFATGGFARPGQPSEPGSIGQSTGPGPRADAGGPGPGVDAGVPLADAGVPGERRPSAGRVVVTTQVVEAGLDLDAALLVTEAAPWPSLIQRAGRCNRSGQRNADTELWWVQPPSPFPYRRQDIDAAVAELARLEGDRPTTEDLLARDVPSGRGAITVLRRGDPDRL